MIVRTQHDKLRAALGLPPGLRQLDGGMVRGEEAVAKKPWSKVMLRQVGQGHVRRVKARMEEPRA